MIVAASVAPGAMGGVRQPIAYNHRLHTQDLEISCENCHVGATSGEQAGPPDLQTCLECHEEAVTDKADEEKIRAYASKGEQIPWKRLTCLPDHVFFSHRRHVTVGQIDCATCHGPMAVQTKPPEKALKTLKMSDCLHCHEKSGASLDCNACHR